MTRPTVGTVATGVGDLHVEIAGSGPPALLWHSLFVGSDQWDAVRGPLAAHRTLVLVDGPGHGRSGAPHSAFTLDGCADAAAAILDRFELARVDWLGNAWGGHVGLVLAVRRPELVATLVTIGAPVAAPARADRLRASLLAAVYRVAGPVGPVVGQVVAAMTADPHGPAARAVRSQLTTADRPALVTALRSVLLGRPDLTGSLARIGTPTLFLTGDADPLWTPGAATAAARGMPDGRVGVIPGSGHLPPLENPAAVIEQVIEFWAHAVPPHDQERT